MTKPNILIKLCAIFMNSITASQSQTHSNVIKTTSDIGRLKIKDMVLFLWPVSKYEASTIIITWKTILSAEARVRERETETKREAFNSFFKLISELGEETSSSARKSGGIVMRGGYKTYILHKPGDEIQKVWLISNKVKFLGTRKRGLLGG